MNWTIIIIIVLLVASYLTVGIAMGFLAITSRTGEQKVSNAAMLITCTFFWPLVMRLANKMRQEDKPDGGTRSNRECE